ncbi:MAG: farnesyl diphosphate synthase [Acidobacteriota bacterium]
MPASSEIDERLDTWRLQINESLDRWLPDETEAPPKLHRAMRYAVFPGGKRLRPVLVLASAELVGARNEVALPGACAVELVHTYSLVHDDLPALDNDEFRRGRPTLHRAFGEALAILAGDALLTCAVDILTTAPHQEHERRLRALAVLVQAAGTGGMIGGQVDDLEASGTPSDPSHVESIHRRKTAALMGASTRIGALLGGGSEDEIRALGRFGDSLGLAFQIVDDLLDLEGDEAEVGKALRKDRCAGKLTFPVVWGAKSSRQKAHALVQEAKQSIEAWGTDARILRDIADRVLHRNR